MIYKNILETIGNTPTVQLNKVADSLANNLWVKLESFNPGGSVKDRPALHMIEEAERRGDLKKGMTIVEPTSGNTGIGLAMVATVKGYPIILTMPSSMSLERQSLLRAYGAKFLLTPAEDGMIGAIDEAKKMAKKKEFFMPMQFENFDNSGAHKSTAEEIWEDTDGQIDVLVCATGTTGTISGTGYFLQKRNPEIKIIAIEPQKSSVLSGGKPGLHALQGMGAGFVPAIARTHLFDRIMRATDDDSITTAQWLSTQEGIFAGISSGAVVWGMTQLAKEEAFAGLNILGILPDTGERYLSDNVF